MADNDTIRDADTSVAVRADRQAGGPELHRYRQAFERALPASQALEAKHLIPINIDLPTAIATTAGRLPGILAFRERSKALPEFDISVFDELETYTLATGHAHTRYMGASAAPEAILELNEKGMKLRSTLYADAVALATRNFISGERIRDFKANIGYKNLAFDLMALASVLRDSWGRISGKTAITVDDLDRAELIGDQLISAVGAREGAPTSVAEVASQRQRNFTLFVKTYDEVRRAISFLRWREDDIERIAPSLYSGRGNSNARKKGGDKTQSSTAQPTVSAPGVTAPGGTTPGVAAQSGTGPRGTASGGTPSASPAAGAGTPPQPVGNPSSTDDVARSTFSVPSNFLGGSPFAS